VLRLASFNSSPPFPNTVHSELFCNFSLAVFALALTVAVPTPRLDFRPALMSSLLMDVDLVTVKASMALPPTQTRLM